MVLQTKRSHKQDPVKMSLFRVVKPPIKSGYAIYGQTSSGKTVLMLKISSSLHDKYGFKVWDVWGGKRNQGENLYWCLPSPYKRYWIEVRKKFRFDEKFFDEEGLPKQYKVNLYYPITKNIPKELPYLKNEDDEVVVDSIPFTIPFKDIDTKLIDFALNNFSDSDKTLWDDLKDKFKDSDGLVELSKKFEKKGNKTNVYKNFFKPLIDMRLLGSRDDENRFDLIKESKDKGIFVLVLHHLPEKFKLFILAWLFQKQWDAMNESKIKGKNLINIREATEFFRATEKSAVEPRFKKFKIFLTEFIRQARGRLGFLLDAQSPTETSGLVSGSFDIEIYGKMPSEDDRKNATEQLKRDGKITSNQIRQIGELEPGEYFFVESGKKALLRYSFLPPCDFFRSSDQNFYNIWKKRRGNRFKNVKGLIQHIDDGFKIKLKEINEIEKERKAKQIEQEKIKEKIEQEKQDKERVEREKRRYEQELKAKREIREKLKKEKNEEKKPSKNEPDEEEELW